MRHIVRAAALKTAETVACAAGLYRELALSALTLVPRRIER